MPESELREIPIEQTPFARGGPVGQPATLELIRDPGPSRFMRVVVAVRELVSIVLMATATLLLIAFLTALQEIGERWNSDPAPAVTECVGEVSC
jgi:hypothetical protein